MVGMVMPRQELWIQDNFDSLSADVILPAGAAMDYVAGAVATPLAGLEKLVCNGPVVSLLNLGVCGDLSDEPWSILRIMVRDFVYASWNRGTLPFGGMKNGTRIHTAYLCL